MFLADGLALLTRHLAYHWCIGIVLPGQNSRVHARQAINAWRPILVLTKEPGTRLRWFLDSHQVTEPRDKTWHPWQKAVGPARHYIAALTEPGALVVDPFLGSGSTALAAIAEGRRFVGCDIDPKAVRATKVRLAEQGPA